MQQQDQFRKIFALVLVVTLSVLFGRMIAPFVEALLIAIVFSGLLYPLHKLLERRLRNRIVAAAAMTLLVLLAIVLPVMFVIAAFTRQAMQLSGSVVPWLQQQAEIASVAFQWPDWLPLADSIDAEEALTNLAGTFGDGGLFVGGLGAVTQTTLMFLLQLGVMLYTMFYLLLAGPSLMKVFDYTPLADADRQFVAEQGISITRATLKGTIVIGVLQGALAGAAFAVVGVPAPIFWAVIMTVLSAIPGIGAALVWIPAVGYLLLTGSHGAALTLGLWCTLVVSTIDNLVRPQLVGHDTQLPPVLVLLGTLGGIGMFGIAGIIIGPLLGGFFVTSWHIFGAAFRRELDGSGAATPLADSGHWRGDRIVFADESQERDQSDS